MDEEIRIVGNEGRRAKWKPGVRGYHWDFTSTQQT